MGQGISKLLMIALLVSPPALCRAGILVQCCNEDAPTPAAAVERSGCCNDPTPSQHPKPAPTPVRQCKACADICTAAFKPPDESDNSISLATVPAAEIATDPNYVAADQRPVLSRAAALPPSPYPPSDLPLLI